MIGLIIIGIVTGLLSGLLGIGGGVVLVPSLTLYKGLGIREAIATSLAVIVFTALVASFKYHGEGLISLRNVFTITVGSIFGTWGGIYLNSKSSAESLRTIFACFLIVVGLKMLIFNSSNKADIQASKAVNIERK